MENLVRKGIRIQKPREVKFSVRPCVFEWLDRMSEELHCNYTVLARGILEDAYDRYCAAAPSEEVPE